MHSDYNTYEYFHLKYYEMLEIMLILSVKNIILLYSGYFASVFDPVSGSCRFSLELVPYLEKRPILFQIRCMSNN